MIVIYGLMILVWSLAGISALVYWGTKYKDLTLSDLCALPGMILLGPLAWVLCWIILGDWNDPILIKRREKK